MPQLDRNSQRENRQRGNEPNFNWRGVVLIVIATKAWTGRGTPLRGGLPSGHAAVAFAGWIAVTYLVGDTHRFVVSALTLIMAVLVAQTRVESGIHSSLEVAYGGALGALVTLVAFQLIG